MKALAKTRPVPGATLVEVDIPRPERGEVLIGVRSVAICGTDIHFYHWDSLAANFQIQFPLILGHEYAGEVVKVGEDVEGLSVGDRVAVETHIPCGVCYQCGLGNEHNCQNLKVIGITYPGAFAKYAIAPAKVAFKLPVGVSFEEGSLFEPVGAAMRGIDEAKISPGDLVVILGCGPIGLAAIQMAKNAGSEQVIAIDINDFRLEMARHFGALVLNPLRDNIVKQVSQIAGRKGGADVILEMSGAVTVFEYLFDIVRSEGKLVTIGLLSDAININVSKNIVLKGLTIKGVFGRRIWETWEHLSSLVESKKINLSGMITHRFPLEEYQDAFRQVQDKAGKVLLVP